MPFTLSQSKGDSTTHNFSPAGGEIQRGGIRRYLKGYRRG